MKKTLQLSACLSILLFSPFLQAAEDQNDFSWLSWSTTGGGDLSFYIEKHRDGFRIVRESMNFQKDLAFIILSPETNSPQEKEIYSLIQQTFQDPRMKKKHPQDNRPTGSWTHVSVCKAENDCAEIEEDQLPGLYDFVKNLPSILQKPKKEGTP